MPRKVYEPTELDVVVNGLSRMSLMAKVDLDLLRDE